MASSDKRPRILLVDLGEIIVRAMAAWWHESGAPWEIG